MVVVDEKTESASSCKMDKRNEDKSLLTWLGLTNRLDFTKAMWLGPILTAVLSILVSVIFLSVLWNFFEAIFHFGSYTGDKDGSSIRNIGLVLAALFGLPFLVWRSLVAAKQVKISDDSLFNDKINDAAKALTSRREISRIAKNELVIREWEDDLVARAAAIDRLEDLANERISSSPRITKLLATYVRGNFPCSNHELSEPLESRKVPRMDLQKAIDTIGRVYALAAKADKSNWRLDLKSCDFDGVNFNKGYFRAADFSESRFEASIFRKSNFEGCLLYHCLLNFGDFHGTNLRGARLDYSILNRPQPVPGGFVRSINMGELRGVTFIAADISALDYLGTAKEISETFATKDTKISWEIEDKMLSRNKHSAAHSLRNTSNLTDRQKEQVLNLEKTGFQNWSPYDSEDMATGHLLQKFYADLKMKHWPFVSG